MKPDTPEEAARYSDDPAEINAAYELFSVLRPCLKVCRTNGRLDTTQGSKTILGFYRTIKDLTKGGKVHAKHSTSL